MSAILGTFADAKSIKTRGVYQLLIEIPIENADHALRVLGGIPQPAEERWVGVAPVAAPKKPADETTTAKPSEATPEPVKTDTADWSEAKRKMVQRSGIIRNEPSFHAYVKNGWHVLWNHERHKDEADNERAAYFIRTSCGVKSCRDLDPDGKSGEAFRRLYARYIGSQHGLGDAQQEQREAGP